MAEPKREQLKVHAQRAILVTVVDPATLWPQDARAAAAALADEAAHAATLAAGVRMVAVPDGGDADPAADPDANQVPDA